MTLACFTLKDSGPGIGQKPNLNGATENNYRIQNDGHVVCVVAIKWVASGDKRYADTAIKFINDWVAKVPSIPDDPMRSGLGGSQMPAAKLAYWDETTHAFVVRPGAFDLLVGAASDGIRAQAQIAVIP